MISIEKFLIGSSKGVVYVSAQQDYMTYQDMVHRTLESIGDLTDVCKKLEMAKSTQALESAAEKMRNKTFTVGIMGEFRRGKSTVINALLGSSIIPSDIIPTSATLNYVRWDTKPGAVINFKDGSKKKVAVEWCQYATNFEKEHDGKEWNYLLIPDTTVVLGRSFEALVASYKEK